MLAIDLRGTDRETIRTRTKAAGRITGDANREVLGQALGAKIQAFQNDKSSGAKGGKTKKATTPKDQALKELAKDIKACLGSWGLDLPSKLKAT